MQIELIPPPVYLKDYVQYFWVLDSNGSDSLPQKLGPLADGCPGIIFQPSESGNFFDQRHQRLPEFFLYGQTITRTELGLVGKFKTLGANFFPNALKSIFGFDAYLLTDTCLDINVLSSHLTERLLHTPAVSQKIEIISSYLLAQIRKTNTGVDAITRYAQAQIIQSKGGIPLKELHKQLNLSERSFERRFVQYVGISPKMFARICRFQASLSQLKQHDYGKLSDVAFDNGYADQSHFIRSFKEFAGYSPWEFQQHPYEAIDNFPVLIKQPLASKA